MKATYIRKIENWRGKAGLYKLDPPFVPDNQDKQLVEFVIVSAVNNEIANETMIFEANKDGKCISFTDLACICDSQSHVDCLKKLGYTIFNLDWNAEVDKTKLNKLFDNLE